jgi:hypothetical protein
LTLLGAVDAQKPDLLRLAVVHDPNGIAIDDADYLSSKLGLHEVRCEEPGEQ